MDPAVALALSLVPELAPALTASAIPDSLVGGITKAIHDVTGALDDSAVRQVLSRDPQRAIALRARLAEIAAAATRPPAAGAAPATQAAAQALTAGQWGAPVVSVLVLATFGTVMWAAMTRVLPSGSETLVNMLLGTLAAMATSVVSYWVGSSAGSATKTEMLFRTKTPGAGPA